MLSRHSTIRPVVLNVTSYRTVTKATMVYNVVVIMYFRTRICYPLPKEWSLGVPPTAWVGGLLSVISIRLRLGVTCVSWLVNAL